MKPKSITMNSVKSSQITHIGHDGDTLAVTFKSGVTYHYHGVSAAQYNAMQSAESVGKYLNSHIKGNHKFTKLDQTKE